MDAASTIIRGSPGADVSTGAPQGASNDSTFVRRLAVSGAGATVETIACPDCDLLQRIPPLPPGGKARCARCGETLVHQRADPLDRPLALTIAAALALILATTMPLLGLSALGRASSTTLLGAAHSG